LKDYNSIKKIKSVRREYNSLVADETLEDYSLRYTPKSFRNFPELLIANTAMGSISFLALEAIGASIAISYGFTTAFWAILTASIIIFLTAIPISYHAAKYNIDIDLITRSAGFGYFGSTITSLIYASFSFIFFALEAAIMAQALELYFGLPLAWGYLVSSIVIIPLVFYGITLINKLQLWTQPIWIIMMVAPFIAILLKEPQAVETFLNFSGTLSSSSEFNVYYFGSAVGISLALIAQIGEQVDYLRFMPTLTKENRIRWWFSMLSAGPGWIILGFLKQMGGILLAGLVLLAGFSLHEAKTPIQMYYVGYQYIFDNPEIALTVATFFIIVSQIKINVTNAYAGSLAWSNFFSRVTHSHPGRVIWMIFNIGIALLLMEIGVFDALEKVLGLYSNVAIAWIGAISADLLINKPLGLSPKIIEFKRAYLYNINPVGIGSMGIASVIAILSFMELFGNMAMSYSSIIAISLALVLSPLIAYLTKGKYYIARKNIYENTDETHYHCEICDKTYEREDMAHCPLHNVNICSLCCSLDSLCHDSCKNDDEKSLHNTIGEFINKLFLGKISTKTSLRIFDFIALTSIFLFIILITIWMIYSANIIHLSQEALVYVKESYITLFISISILASILIWWILLTHENRILAEDELEEQNELLRQEQLKSMHQAQMIEQTHDSVTSTDLNGNILSWNLGSVTMFGYTTSEAIGQNISILHKKEDLLTFSQNIKTLMKTGKYSTDTMLITKSKESIHVSLSLSLLRDEDSNPIAMIAYAQDISRRIKVEKELAEQRKILDHQAHYDALTKLPNRILFHDRVDQAIEKAKRKHLKFALLFIDLDHFKEINDSLGHDVGDEILKTVSKRLEEAVRKEDTVARLGGDEFTVVLEDLKEPQDASFITGKILHFLSESIQVNDNVLYVSSSIGISIYPDDGIAYDNLLKYADSAMYKAKDEGRNNYQYYNTHMTELAFERVVMETALRDALKNEEFVVYFQAQVDGTTDKLIGMEALVRWQHPRMGLVFPDRFIPLAETTGLIIELDRQVMKIAMTQISQWYKKGLNPGRLAMNLTVKQLKEKDFIEMLTKLIKETGCKSQWIAFEVTEGQIMTHPDEAIKILKQISDLDIELAVDDFGTGYSSLAYLKRLPIDKLKIDQAFVRDLPDDEEDAGIAKAVIALASSLKLKVIAEGVETKGQRDFLVENGCKNIQGYFYSKPIPADEFETKFLK